MLVILAELLVIVLLRVIFGTVGNFYSVGNVGSRVPAMLVANSSNIRRVGSTISRSSSIYNTW